MLECYARPISMNEQLSYRSRISVSSAVITLILLAASTYAQSQVPADQLAKPPAGAQAFTILSTAGTNGKAFLWTTADGARMSRESILLRGQVWELDQSVKFGSDGMPSSMIVRGVTPQGDAAETFEV